MRSFSAAGGLDHAELREAWGAGPGGGRWGSKVPGVLHARRHSWIWEVSVGEVDTSWCGVALLWPLGRRWQLTAVMLKSHAASRHEPGCFGKLSWAQRLFLKIMVRQGGGEKTTRAWAFSRGGA